MGLETNLDKTNDLVCIPGNIRGKWSKAAYNLRDTRKEETFRER